MVQGVFARLKAFLLGVGLGCAGATGAVAQGAGELYLHSNGINQPPLRRVDLSQDDQVNDFLNELEQWSPDLAARVREMLDQVPALTGRAKFDPRNLNQANTTQQSTTLNGRIFEVYTDINSGGPTLVVDPESVEPPSLHLDLTPPQTSEAGSRPLQYERLQDQEFWDGTQKLVGAEAVVCKDGPAEDDSANACHHYAVRLFQDGHQACSGVLIAPSFVLTAEHCFFDGKRGLTKYDPKTKHHRVSDRIKLSFDQEPPGSAIEPFPDGTNVWFFSAREDEPDNRLSNCGLRGPVSHPDDWLRTCADLAILKVKVDQATVEMGSQKLIDLGNDRYVLDETQKIAPVGFFADPGLAWAQMTLPVTNAQGEAPLVLVSSGKNETGVGERRKAPFVTVPFFSEPPYYVNWFDMGLVATRGWRERPDSAQRAAVCQVDSGGGLFRRHSVGDQNIWAVVGILRGRHPENRCEELLGAIENGQAAQMPFRSFVAGDIPVEFQQTGAVITLDTPKVKTWIEQITAVEMVEMTPPQAPLIVLSEF
ncbi:MAG: trypsin-like serine protease [Pseudomonadota bacterium]